MRYVVLGSSAAGINGVRELRRLDPGSEIVLVSKDEAIYSRCILHHYLGGMRTLKQLNFAEEDFAEKYQVCWKKGTACIGLDRENKQVILENGERLFYDKLLIATGSHTYLPPIPYLSEAVNVAGFRNLEDMEVIRREVKAANQTVVLGAGLVGMDCITGLLEMGEKPVLVEMAGWMLSKQLDTVAAARYQKAYADQGIIQYYGIGITEVELDENRRIRALRLSNGGRILCDFLVVTAGVRANVDFLEGSGIEVNRLGLVYDESGRTNDENIYGAGDVSGARPIWPVAVKEGIIAANNMAGGHQRMTDFFASKSTMNFLGIPSMSLGDVNASGEGIQMEIRHTKDSYKKILHKDGKIIGAVLQGDLAYSGILQQLIARRIDVAKVKKPLFDIDYSDFFHIDENFEFYYK